MPSCFCSLTPTRAASTQNCAMPAYDVQIFWPSMRQPPSTSVAFVLSAARSEPASGSLKPWHQMTCARRDRREGGPPSAASVPNAMIAGPTQLRPMYCAPRGSWCAHISSRTTVCSHTDPPRPPYSTGHASVRSCSAASRAQNRCAISRSAGVVGERAEEVGGDLGGDERSQLGAERVGGRPEVVVHYLLQFGSRRSTPTVRCPVGRNSTATSRSAMGVWAGSSMSRSKTRATELPARSSSVVSTTRR